MTVEHPRGAGSTFDGAREGADADRFDAELRPLIPTALRLAAAMRLDAHDAEDAVQTAALRAWRRRDNRRPDTDLRPWFLAIVANECRETRRSRWASVLRFADPPAREAPAIDTAGTLDVISALRRVPPRVRLALVLRFYLDLPYDEVASISGCSVDAARSRVRRGIETLKTTLAVQEH